jgi:hypothetical protein
MEQGDRRLETLLERVDALTAEMHGISRRLDRLGAMEDIARELHELNRSLQAIAYAALGQRPPQVRRRQGGS